LLAQAWFPSGMSHVSQRSVLADILVPHLGIGADVAAEQVDAFLVVQVDDLDAVTAALPAGTDVLVAHRTTFYGSTECIVRDAAGHVITFAQFAEEG